VSLAYPLAGTYTAETSPRKLWGTPSAGEGPSAAPEFGRGFCHA